MQVNYRNILSKGLWLLCGVIVIVLFGAAISHKQHLTIKDVKVEIKGGDEHLFIDETDVKQMLEASRIIIGNKVQSIELQKLENKLKANPWVKNAELYIDNQQNVQANIIERQPIVRVFTLQGTSFYVDSNGFKLPLSEKLSARVPIVTNFPTTNTKMTHVDSMLFSGAVSLGKYIMADSFWMAQVAQIDITPQATFELIPTIGDQLICLGTADNIDAKFKKLRAFYQQVWLNAGVNTYEKIDLQYNNQIVAIRKGTKSVPADSTKAVELLNQISKNGLGDLKDSVNIVKSLSKNIIKPLSADSAKNKSIKPKFKKEPIKNILPNKAVANTKPKIKTLSNMGKYQPKAKAVMGSLKNPNINPKKSTN